MPSLVTRWCCIGLLFVGMGLLCSCANKDDQGAFGQDGKYGDGPEHALPRLDQLTQTRTLDQAKQSPLIDSGAVAAALLTRVWLPADQSINNVWREVSTASLSDAELMVWHRNQMRAAVVSKKKLNEILAKVPAHYGVQQQIMTLSSDLIALDPANNQASHRATWVEIQGQSKIYSQGKMQLLIAADQQSGHQVKLTLVPHQYLPRVTLLPRDPAQAVLDGNVFYKLMLRVLLTPDQVLLIAPDVPTPVFDDTRPPPSTTQPADAPNTLPATQPADDVSPASANQPLVLPPMSTRPESKPVPFGLGQALFSGRQVHRQMYQLLIFEVRPITQAASPQSH